MKTKLCLLIFCFLTFVPFIWSQEVTGNLEGKVMDPEGEPVLGVNISVEGVSLQGVRSTKTNDQGYFRILALPPGQYSVKVQHPAFQEASVKDVSVQLGKTTSLGEVRIQFITEEHEVVVQAERPLIDPSSTEIGTNLANEEFVPLPLERSYRSLAALLPQVNSSHLGDEVNFAGATGLENKYFIDGVDVTDPFRGITGTNLPYNFVKEVEIRTGGYQAEYRSSLGGILNVITYSGGNEFRGQLFGFFSNNRFRGDPRQGAYEPNTGDFSEYDFGLGMGGPIIRDKLWFYGAYSPTFNREDVNIPGTGLHNDHSTTHTFAGKLTWQANNSNNLVLMIFGDPTKRRAVGETFADYFGLPSSFSNPDPYLADMETGGVNLSLKGKHIISSDIFLETWLSQIRRKEKYEAATESGREELLFIDKSVGSLWSGGYPTLLDNLSVQSSAGMKGTFILSNHTLKAGLEYRDNRLDNNFRGGAIVYLGGGVFEDFDLIQLGTVHYRMPSLFIQDSWMVTDKLRINFGLRWDKQHIIGSDGQLAQRINPMLQPRMGFVFMPGKRGKQKIFGSFGRFSQELATWLSTAYHLEGTVWTFKFYSHDPRIEPSNPFMTISASDGKIHPEIENLEGQFYDEFNLGYEREIADDFVFSISGIYRILRQGIVAGTDLQGVSIYGNPGTGALSHYPKIERQYSALELTLRRVRGKKFNFISSYVLSRNYGNYPGLYCTDFNMPFPNTNATYYFPEMLVNSEGLLPNDRTHVFKFSGWYRFDFGLTVGSFFLLESGTPLNEFGSLPLGNPFHIFLQKRGTAGRTSFIWDLNFRLSYELSRLIQSSLRPRLLVDVFHVGSQRKPMNFDQIHYLSQDQFGNPILPNPFYGHATKYQPPMTLRVGIEIDF
jgi:hypothetical protein